MSEIRTLAEVMDWLPSDIRDALTVTTPCPSGAHDWDHERRGREVWAADQLVPVYAYEWWTCRACSATTRHDPQEFA